MATLRLGNGTFFAVKLFDFPGLESLGFYFLA